MADRPCPCGHGPNLACLNGRIYGPCGEASCIGPCADTYGRCKSLDGCCDPESNVGRVLTAGVDKEPPKGSRVRDDCGIEWINDGYRPCCWVRPDLIAQDIHDPESWGKVAGNYGPVTVLEWGDGDD